MFKDTTFFIKGFIFLLLSHVIIYLLRINHADVQDLSAKFQIQLKDVMELAVMLNKNIQEVEKGDKKLEFLVTNESTIQMSIKIGRAHV